LRQGKAGRISPRGAAYIGLFGVSGRAQWLVGAKKNIEVLIFKGRLASGRLQRQRITPSSRDKRNLFFPKLRFLPDSFAAVPRVSVSAPPPPIDRNNNRENPFL